MNKNEKLLLLQLILMDIKEDCLECLEGRVNMAFELAQDLNMNTIVESIREFKVDMETHDYDCRHFKLPYVYGGYEELEDIHELDFTISDKSEKFKQNTLILNNPESLFEDWHEFVTTRNTFTF